MKLLKNRVKTEKLSSSESEYSSDYSDSSSDSDSSDSTDSDASESGPSSSRPKKIKREVKKEELSDVKTETIEIESDSIEVKIIWKNDFLLEIWRCRQVGKKMKEKQRKKLTSKNSSKEKKARGINWLLLKLWYVKNSSKRKTRIPRNRLYSATLISIFLETFFYSLQALFNSFLLLSFVQRRFGNTATQSLHSFMFTYFWLHWPNFLRLNRLQFFCSRWNYWRKV